MVVDTGGLSAKDTITVTVDSVSTINHPPVANAGKDTSINLPVNTYDLDGTRSSDPDNNITSYLWTKISGPAVFVIANDFDSLTQVSNLTEGIYEFELVVTDAGGLKSKDTVQVTVIQATTSAYCGFPQTQIGSLTIPRQSVSILAAGNKILFAGGFESAGGPPLNGSSSRVDIYDRVTQTWSIAELSLNRFHVATIALGNQVFFAGGDNGQPSSRIDRYDASDNTWSSTELSEAREAIVAATAGNKVVFAGGIVNGGGSNKVDIYDQSTGTWSTATLSQPTNGTYIGKYNADRSGVITVGNTIYFLLRNNTVDVFDAQANTWSTLTGNGNPLWGNTVALIGNSIYFPGTSNGQGLSNTLEIYNTNSKRWTSINMVQARSDMVAVSADNKIFWAGGYDACCMIKDIEIADISSGTHSLHQLQDAPGWIDVLKTGNKVIFSYLGKSDIYDINTHTWSTCNASFAQAIAVGNTVYLVGEDNTQVWKIELN
jgi:hypothetical protein